MRMRFVFLVAAYNEALILPVLCEKFRTIESRKINFEVCILDNASTDDTQKILNEKSKEYPWLRFLRIEKIPFLVVSALVAMDSLSSSIILIGPLKCSSELLAERIDEILSKCCEVSGVLKFDFKAYCSGMNVISMIINDPNPFCPSLLP